MLRKHFPLLLILAISATLRLIALNQSLWLDEAIEWWGVSTFGLWKLLSGYMVGDFNPPGHHILMWFWVRVFGDSEISLRMPSVLFGVGTVLMVYKIGRTLERPDPAVRQGQAFIGLISAALAATNGLLLYYSQEARTYAMTTFFVTAAVWAFLKLQKKFSIQMLTTYYVLLTTALYSHYLAWLMIPVFLLGSFGSVGIVRSIAPVLATIPIWPLLMKQLHAGISSAGNSQWAMLSQTTPKNVALVLVKFVTGRIPFPHELVWQICFGAAVLLFWVGVGFGAWRIVKQIKWGNDATILLVYWAFAPFILGGVIGLFVPVFSYFRFLFVLPAGLLLFTRGVTNLRARMAMVGIFSLFSFLYLFNENNHRENWRGAVAELHKQEQDTRATVMIYPAVQPPFDYYDRGRSNIIDAVLSHPSSLIVRPSLWYIPYGQPIFDPENRIRVNIPSWGFRRAYEQHFRGVTLERWEKTSL